MQIIGARILHWFNEIDYYMQKIKDSILNLFIIFELQSIKTGPLDAKNRWVSHDSSQRGDSLKYFEKFQLFTIFQDILYLGYWLDIKGTDCILGDPPPPADQEAKQVHLLDFQFSVSGILSSSWSSQCHYFSSSFYLFTLTSWISNFQFQVLT